MKLIDLYTSVPPEEVTTAFLKAYPHDELELDFYKNVFLTLVITRGTVEKDQMIAIDHYVSRHDDPVDDEESYSVSLLVPCAGNTDENIIPSDLITINDVEYIRYSMSFTAWDQLLGCEVLSLSDVPLSLAEQAAHIFYEMTWHGMESHSQEQHARLKERIGEFEEDMEAHAVAVKDGLVEEGSLPKGFKVFDINDLGLRPEEIKKQYDNMMTMRSFVNGVQTWPKPE